MVMPYSVPISECRTLSPPNGCHLQPVHGRDDRLLDRLSHIRREECLMGTIQFRSKLAKDLVTSALQKEDNRYNES